MTKSRLFVASLLTASALSFAAPAQAQRVDHIVAFGDSYADDGNAFQLAGIDPATTVVYTTGRFSGGTNYVDTLGNLLNVGIDNFAIGGAKTDNTNTSGPLPGFTFEVTNFLGVGPQHPAFPTYGPTFGPHDLVTVSIGGNDSRQYQQLGGTVPGASAAAATAVTNATNNLNLLVGAGARNISFLAGNTAGLPEVIGDANAQAVRSAFSTAFNTGIQSTLAGYAANGVIVHYLDGVAVLNNVIANPAAYGIANLYCPAFPNPTCISNSGSGYLFYGDGVHLTSDGFRIVGQYIAVQLEAPLVLQGASDLSLDVAHEFGRTLTARMDVGSPRDGDTLNGLKFFVVGDGYTRHLDAGPRNEAYRSSGVGVTAGAEVGFGSGVVGLAANYSRPKLNFGNDNAENEARTIQLGGYAGFGLGGAFAQGYAGYGWDKHDIDRTGVVEGMEADPKGHHFIAGAKAGYLLPLGGLRIGPVVALDYAKAKVDGYTETGDPALTLNVDSLTYRSLRGSAGIELRSDLNSGGIQLRPYASAAIEKDFTGDERTLRFAQTSAPTIVNSFALEDTSKKAYARVGLGFSAAIFSKVNLDVGGSATIGKDQGEETSANIGFRVGF